LLKISAELFSDTEMVLPAVTRAAKSI